MAIQLGTTAQLDAALRRGFSEVSARPKPETKMTDVIAALAALGVTAELDEGLLVLKQDDKVFNVALCLRGFAAKPENAKFFVTAADDPKTWSAAMRTKYISEHGPDAWGRLVNGKALEPAVKVLDRNMSRADYLSLTTKEKLAFIAEFDADAVSAVMGKRK
jgi:hypothetical protein